MNRRLYTRFDYTDKFIQLMIVINNQEMYPARLKDISRGGISFYSGGPTLFDEIDDKDISVQFFIDDKPISLDVEPVRESRCHLQTFHGCQFKGVNSLVYNAIFLLLHSRMQMQRELEETFV